MVKVGFFTLLRLKLGVSSVEMDIEGDIPLGKLLYFVEEKIKKPFMKELTDDNELLDRAIILVNGRNVRHLQKLDTIIHNGDTVSLFPPGGGG